MKEEKWLIEVVVGEKTHVFKYETKDEVLFDVDSILHAISKQWIHIQDAYLMNKDIKMVSYREIK